MIFKRAVAKLRAQDWMAIAVELAIVVLGVFIGTWVANWNQEQGEERTAQKMVGELRPGVLTVINSFDGNAAYLRTTARYSDTAFAGWRAERGVSDDQFVIAAYQASQTTAPALNAGNWADVYGGAQLSKLSDPALRRSVATIMSIDFGSLDESNLRTPYVQHVREVIPEDIQDAIRAQCGDTADLARPFLITLPATCHIDLPRERWAAAARALRNTPDLIPQLRWRRAATATYIENLGFLRSQYADALQRIDKASR